MTTIAYSSSASSHVNSSNIAVSGGRTNPSATTISNNNKNNNNSNASINPGHSSRRDLGARQVGDTIIVAPALPQTKWTLADFEVLHYLGGGNYGAAYMAAVRGSNYIVALKKIPIKKIVENKVATQLRREVEIAFNTRHKHLLRTYGYFYDDKDFFLIMEPCANGMLYTELMKAQRFPPPIAAKYVAQLSEALLYLHQHHTLHRDVKPENILMDHKGDLKLADFGWSVHDPRNRRNTSCGTPEYYPPEIVSRKAYDHTADLWCVGIFCFELLVGKTPFVDKERSGIYHKIMNISYKMPTEIPLDAKDLIESLLKKDGNKRISVVQVLNHPFIVNNYYKLNRMEPPTGKRGRVDGE